MKIIGIRARGIWLEPSWAVAGTRGSYGSWALKIDFSPEWEGMRRRVTFFPADGMSAVEVSVTNGEAIVPDSVMECAGSACFIIDGERDGERLISERGSLRVIDTARPGGRREEYAGARKERKEDGIAIF